MEVEVEVTIKRAVGNLTFACSDSDAVSVLLAHLPGFDKEEIDVSIDEKKTEICISGEGQGESLQAVLLSRLHVTREMGSESFSEVFQIPNGVVLEWIETWFDEEKRILVVLMPKLIREEQEQEEYVEKLEPKEKFEDARKIEEEMDEDEPIPRPKPSETKPNLDEEEPKESQVPAEILDEPLEILLNSGEEEIDDNGLPTLTSTQPEETDLDSNLNGDIPINENPIQAPEHQEPIIVPKSTPNDDGTVEQIEVPTAEAPTQSTKIDEEIPTDDDPIRPQLDDEPAEELKVPTGDEVLPEVEELIEPPETDLGNEEIEDLKLPEGPNGTYQEEEDENGIPNAETPGPAPETAKSTELEEPDTNLDRSIDEAQVPTEPPENNLDDEKFEDLELPTTKPAELEETDRTSQHENETETPINKIPTDGAQPPIEPPETNLDDEKFEDLELPNTEPAELEETDRTTNEKPTDEAQLPIKPPQTNLDDEKFEDLELPTTKPAELEETGGTSQQEDETEAPALEAQPPIEQPTKSSEPEEIDRNSHQEDETEIPDAETPEPAPKTIKSTELEESDTNLEEIDEKPANEAQEPIKTPEINPDDESVQNDRNSEIEPDPDPETAKSTEFEKPDAHLETKDEEITDESVDPMARDEDPKKRERELAGKEREDGSGGELGFGGEERLREIGTRERERREPLSLSPVSILAGSAFILSLVVLMFHFLKERKRQ